MTEHDILEQMKSIGVNVGNILNATSSAEGILSGLMSKKDEIPEDLFNQLDESLKKTREGKSDMKNALLKLEETLKKNGNNNSK